MGTASEHVFHRKSASPQLLRAMEQLGERTGRSLTSLENIPLGEAYALAVQAYGADLPDFWRVWYSWDQTADQAAPMGDLTGGET